MQSEILKAHPQARLRVYAANGRGRRFWQKLGWRPTGERAAGSVPPYAELLTYARDTDSSGIPPSVST